jgi:putative transcriptional regulator
MRKAKSKILDAVHKTAKGLRAAGAIDQVAVCQFCRLCLPTETPSKSEPIKRIRERLHTLPNGDG